jgi:hypothetical protein
MVYHDNNSFNIEITHCTMQTKAMCNVWFFLIKHLDHKKMKK